MFAQSARELIELLQKISADQDFMAQFQAAEEKLQAALLGGKKILVAGNGGSAADAQHFAAEFMATFKKEKRKGYPVLALTTDTSFLTAWSNDFDYADIFAREVQTWGREGDVFIGISTSGNSENVFRAAREAKRLGLHTIGLLGAGGGRIKAECETAIVVPSSATARIQEVHMLVLHAWCEDIVPKL